MQAREAGAAQAYRSRRGYFAKCIVGSLSLFAIVGCQAFGVPGGPSAPVEPTRAPGSAELTRQKVDLYRQAKERNNEHRICNDKGVADERRENACNYVEKNGWRLTPNECEILDPEPRVHAIGSSRIVTIDTELTNTNAPDEDAAAPAEKAGTADESARGPSPGPHLEIVVEGRDLDIPGCVVPNIKVGGTIDALFPRDFEVSESTATGSAFTVRLQPEYLRRLKSGDQLSVWIGVDSLIGGARAGSDDQARSRLLTFAHRRFTVFTVDFFRNEVQRNRVKAHNFHSFPLPTKETEELFGPLIADNFFVVRLSVRNDTDQDKLITTGMIIASGRVLVEPEDGIPYTVPVELAPSSLEQVYTILADEAADQPRPTIFRGLDFIGALATAANLAFGSSVDLTEGIGFFTGVFIPELRNVWPDRQPGYERNVVAFSMQDLNKIPKGAVSNQKLLFFSKNKIEGIIQDPNLYLSSAEPSRGLLYEIFGPEQPWRPAQPNAAVVSVAFDTMDIPYENVFSVAALTQQERLANAQVRIRNLIDTLTDLRGKWSEQTGSVFLGALRYEELTSAVEALIGASDAVSAAKTATADEEVATTLGRIVDQLEALKAVAVALSPGTIQSSLVGNLDELRFQEGQIDTVRRAIARGADTAVYEEQIEAMEAVITSLSQALQFYASSADIIAQASNPKEFLGGMLANLKADAANHAENAVNDLERYLAQLRTAHEGLEIVNALEPAEPPEQQAADEQPGETEQPDDDNNS